MEHCDVLVVGGGAAGMAAACAAANCGATVVLAEREDALGGVLPQCLHHGFGLVQFGADLTGAEYARRVVAELADTPVRILAGTTVLSVHPDHSALLSGAKTGLFRLTFRQLVLASGCRETPVGALPVVGTRPAGIFTAGEAQRLVNLEGRRVGNTIVILGGGDIGLVMAQQLTRNGCRVAAVVEQRAFCGGQPRHQKACFEQLGIPLLLRATVTEVHGRGRVSAVTVRHLDTGAEEILPCDTLLTAVGLVPERELLRPLGTPLPGWVHLCGNCEHVHRIVDTVTAQGEAAGHTAALQIGQTFNAQSEL
ncbi:hypothetical protein B5G43_10830 [Flavonifractor sp. An92]|uniref:NAD(P)/FAD-dependent oxidoreductase n=1 Tax=Flavonifractor sp. An92 TaxID=1965666 RepID=UPI000B36A790|nr:MULTISPECIES: FAD/NAD(P)-binding oxidoreductase [unclassified Flavonifractor]OUN05913.1 hypothetical protein B5G43_10830 [Flavonifractor sp. An92]OUQ24998.1 hypothetical protein B5E80_06015 [Flavonifractor sp. An135]